MASASQRARKNRQRKYVNREMTNQPTINQTNNTGEKKMDKEITDLSEYKKTRKFSIKRLSKLVRTKIVAVKTAVKRFAAWWKAPVETTNGADCTLAALAGAGFGTTFVVLFWYLRAVKLAVSHSNIAKDATAHAINFGEMLRDITKVFVDNPEIANQFNAVSPEVKFT